MKRILAMAGLAWLAGCAAGPNYHRPDTPSAPAYKEIGEWKPATPSDHLPRGDWWSIYADPKLDELLKAVAVSNQNVRQAEAQFRAARALVQSARAAYFPTLGANASATRSRGSTSRFQLGSASGNIANTYNLSLDAGWELDLWGRLRREAEGARATAEAGAADLAAATLSAQAELAQDYFQIRVLDDERAFLDEEIAGFQRSLKITQNQYAVGVAKRSDVLQAQTQLQSTQAQALDLDITRAQLEHAIAVLVGSHPSTFSLPKQPLNAAIPDIPAGLPSDLLERRPDIAAAERRVIAANAQIGAARAAWFPTLSLSGTLGYQSSAVEHLVSAANRVWSAGPAAALSLFDGGARLAASRQAAANYDAAVAAYRQATLAAFRDVEDNLAAVRILTQEREVQDAATRAAREAESIALNQYKAGTVSYLEVVVAQSTALSNARSSLNLRGRHLAASVALIKALGGGWRGAPAAADAAQPVKPAAQ
jgi:NodT family efflux transporter outer membrane factor (OMF) lipoprotein